jgi:hypothetical protein
LNDGHAELKRLNETHYHTAVFDVAILGGQIIAVLQHDLAKRKA